MRKKLSAPRVLSRREFIRLSAAATALIMRYMPFVVGKSRKTARKTRQTTT